MKQRLVVRYSMSFKQQVVSDLESGRFNSIAQAQRHYGITGAWTVQRWLKRYGRNHLCPKVIRVEKPNERDEILRLRNQVKQLEQALGRTQAERVLNEVFLEMACKRLGEDVEGFKKKVAGTRSVNLESEAK